MNYRKVFDVMVNELAEYITTNQLKSLVLGISGGIDSTVCAAIASEAAEKCNIPFIGRSITIESNPDWEVDCSLKVGKAFCSDFQHVCLDHQFQVMKYGILNYEGGSCWSSIAQGNIKARLRMIYLYHLAGINKGIVIDTDNLSEHFLGFWTIHGDVGDFGPIGALWKTEVYKLASELASIYKDRGQDPRSEAIRASIELTPTDGLGISSSDLEQIGANSYTDVDAVLQNILEVESDSKEIRRDMLKTSLGEDVYDAILSRFEKSKYKRLPHPVVIKRQKYE